MKKRVSNYLQTLITCCLLFIVTIGKAQNIGINVTGATPNAKAMLDIDATGMATKGGLLIPRLTTAERNAITAPIPMSLLIYNTTTNCFEAWNQTANSWIAFGCITCATPTAPAATAATANTSSSFIANWAAVTGATNYFLDVATNASFSSFVSGYNNINIGNSTSATIANLNCNTTYYYRVRAANTCTSSVSANSNSITVTTPTCSGGSALCIPTGSNTPFGNFVSACTGYSYTGSCSSFTDTRDGKPYGVVQMFNQCWMNSDLTIGNTFTTTIDYFANPSPVPTSGPDNTFTSIEAIGDVNNFLGGNAINTLVSYTWDEAMAYGPAVTGTSIGPRGICPLGWHIPTPREWKCLEENVVYADLLPTIGSYYNGVPTSTSVTSYTSANIFTPYYSTVDGLSPMFGSLVGDGRWGTLVNPYGFNFGEYISFPATYFPFLGNHNGTYWENNPFGYFHAYFSSDPAIMAISLASTSGGTSQVVQITNVQFQAATVRCLKD